MQDLLSRGRAVGWCLEPPHRGTSRYQGQRPQSELPCPRRLSRFQLSAGPTGPEKELSGQIRTQHLGSCRFLTTGFAGTIAHILRKCTLSGHVLPLLLANLPWLAPHETTPIECWRSASCRLEALAANNGAETGVSTRKRAERPGEGHAEGTLVQSGMRVA